MRKRLTHTLSITLFLGTAALVGCKKESLIEDSLKVDSLAQVQSVGNQATARAAWLRFVDRVERGEQKDPSGQYVSKSTQVAVDAAKPHISRPKFDAANPEFARHYITLSNGEVSGVSTLTSTTNDGPVDVCDGCEGTGGVYYPPAPQSTFTSSEGLGGNSYISDLKIIYNSSGDAFLASKNYIKLNADLNKGAGGAYIYFAFTRNPSDVQTAPDNGMPSAGAYDVLRGFESNTNGGRFGPVRPNPYFLYMWTPQTTYGWSNADLNGGAGGQYIFSYQSKNTSLPNSAYITEVGVLSGNSSTIMPPTGWEKYPNDLNEGAGGDYIYFCYKH